MSLLSLLALTAHFSFDARWQYAEVFNIRKEILANQRPKSDDGQFRRHLGSGVADVLHGYLASASNARPGSTQPLS